MHENSLATGVLCSVVYVGNLVLRTLGLEIWQISTEILTGAGSKLVLSPNFSATSGKWESRDILLLTMSFNCCR